MNPEVVKKTQDTLGKIIKKPPLTEKLLSKPPFRFLHDICTEVIRTSGFMKGLFTDEEMDSKNVTAKEDKINFLQKVIDCVTLVGGNTLSARPSKIIAGHEPENSNELLQSMARCIRKKLSSVDAVEMILGGKTMKQGRGGGGREKPPSGSKKSDGSSDQREAPTEKRSKHDRSSDGKRERSADKRHRSSSGRRKDREQSSEKNKEPPEGEEASHGRKDRDRRSKHRDKRQQEEEEEGSTPSKPGDEGDVDSQNLNQDPSSRETVEGAESNAPTRAPRPASAKGQRRRPATSRTADPDGQADSPDPNTTAPRKLARPPSARPAAPRVRKQKESSVEGRIDSGGQQRTAPIIVDRDQDTTPSDDDEQFVIEENNVPDFEASTVPDVNGNDAAHDEDEDKTPGHLVTEILKTKKEWEYAAAGQQGGKQKHTEIQRSKVATAQQQKERQMIMKEIDQLRNSVQKLCQSAAPLAKIIDYIQEDMDAMQNELKFWNNENKQHAIKLKEEETVTQNNIEPLNLELQELDQSIASYRNRMAATKANIIKNDEKIKKMVVAVATQS
ncbi:TRAF3-interacting protein 1-like [Clavelina lepadiformis]|uniref:TRAF3-interacting protein 1-like n=1 Tax=Clavelina lepadiformis TaxID=159417 RepID=UPI00404196F2